MASSRSKGKQIMEEGRSRIVEEKVRSRLVVEEGRNGRYVRYTKRLGISGSSEVYEGLDRCNGVLIAWKKITVTDSCSIEKCLEKAEMLKVLHHENIIKCHDYWECEENGRLKINMITELASSWSLSDYLKKHETLVGNTSVIKSWSKQILSALKCLHSHKPRMILHRDLNCDNILICGESGNIKLANFDIACYEPKSAGEKAIWGKPELREPDPRDGKQSGATDIYSFGMCVLQMMTKDELYSELYRTVAQNDSVRKRNEFYRTVAQNDSVRKRNEFYRTVAQNDSVRERNELKKADSQLCHNIDSGIMPDALKNLEDQKVRKFIEGCLATAQNMRPSASALLKHPFFAKTKPMWLGYSLFTKWDKTKRSFRSMPKLSLFTDVPVLHEIRSQEQ